MKYIRTIYGHIYETTGQDKNHPRYYNIANANLKIDALEIVMQADTIEELCDEFVIVGSDGEKAQEKSLIELELNWKYYILESNESYEVYGAIWTGKGLIYVAKMNNKGELELL